MTLEEYEKDNTTPESIEKDIKHKGMFNYFQDYLKEQMKSDKAYIEEMENRARRERNAKLIGDIATVAAQGAALAQGARQFTPVQPKDYSQQFQRIADYRNNLAKQYGQMGLGYKMQDYQNALAGARADEAYGRQREIAKAQAKAAAEALAQKQQFESEENRKKREFEKEENEKKQRNAITVANIRASSKDNQSQGKGKNTITLSVDGRPTVYTYDKINDDALQYIYYRMRDIAKQKGMNDIQDIKMMVGEGGDQRSKMLSIIKSRLPEFPELNEEVLSVIGIDGGYSSPGQPSTGRSSAPWMNHGSGSSTSQGKKKAPYL